MTLVTLCEYANDREYVVAVWTSTGQQTGESAPVGHPDMDFVERRGLLDLEGTVEPDGSWQWDGQGNPTDDRRNSIRSVSASVDPAAWAALVAEYEADV